MKNRENKAGLSTTGWIIILAALAKFSIHMYNAPDYGFFGDELYTIALSRHPAWGYVDLPPLVPALVAISRALLGESLFAMHVFPALAGSATLVFVCLIAREFGGKWFAVAISALGFIGVPIWLGVNSIFAYDGIDQMVLAAFLYVLVRFLRTGNRKLWLLLGLLAGMACLAKTTILFFGPGFLLALLISKYRHDLLTPWPWLGAGIFAVVVSPYLFWQMTNQWPTLEYWAKYGTARVYQASPAQYLTNLLAYMHPLLTPLWLVGLYAVFRPLNKVNYRFLGLLFLATLALMFALHASIRMLAALFMPLLAAGAVFVEQLSAKAVWGKWLKAAVTVYLAAVAVFSILLNLPILPIDQLQAFAKTFDFMTFTVKEFNGQAFRLSPILSGRVGWDDLVQEVAAVYAELPPEEQAIAGIYTDWYMPAGAIDHLGIEYGLPHAVSGALTYYLWGPGSSWEVMIIVTHKTNNTSVFFEQCELEKAVEREYDVPVGRPFIYVCRKPKVSAEVIWSSMKSYR